MALLPQAIPESFRFIAADFKNCFPDYLRYFTRACYELFGMVNFGHEPKTISE
jgi:hypothetical protein